MEPILIKIDWIYFLGIIGTLLLIAWKASGRFATLEVSMAWMKEILTKMEDRMTKLEGRMDNAFGNSSPVALLPKGKEVLEKSGLKEYIDKNKDQLTNKCKNKKELINPYDIQECVFECFDTLDFGDFENKLKEASYNYGMSIETVRRIGAIYFRDLLLLENKFTPEDLDKPKT